MFTNGASGEISEQRSKNAGTLSKRSLNKHINFKYFTYYNIDRINYLLYIIFNMKIIKLTYIMIHISQLIN